MNNVLTDVLDFLEHRDRMNSAIHQMPVRWSPLTESYRNWLNMHGLNVRFLEKPEGSAAKEGE